MAKFWLYPEGFDPAYLSDSDIYGPLDPAEVARQRELEKQRVLMDYRPNIPGRWQQELSDEEIKALEAERR